MPKLKIILKEYFPFNLLFYEINTIDGIFFNLSLAINTIPKDDVYNFWINDKTSLCY